MAAEQSVSGESSGIKTEEVMLLPEITGNLQEVKREEDIQEVKKEEGAQGVKKEEGAQEPKQEESTQEVKKEEGTQEVKKEEGTQEPKKPSIQLIAPWSDHEIRSFTQEWEFYKHLMHPRFKKNHMLSKWIARGLRQRGIKKSWRQCLHMLISLMDLYHTIKEANQKPRSEPLPCPYGEALHRIMDPNGEDNVSGPPWADVTNLPPPEYQPQPILVPIEHVMWEPPHVIYLENPQVPGWKTWAPIPPWLPPQPYPAILPEGPILCQQWSTSSDSDADSGLHDNFNLDPNFV